jgi:hypothetical protein
MIDTINAHSEILKENINAATMNSRTAAFLYRAGLDNILRKEDNSTIFITSSEIP